MLYEMEQQIKFLENYNTFDDYEDTKSVKSKIIKPHKGGFFFKWKFILLSTKINQY